MTNLELNFAALESCLQTLDHLFIEIGRLKPEPEYEEKRGGYGDVRVATLDPRTPTSRLVAAKTIRLRARCKEPQRIAFRLARELRVWARLQHPHVLPLLGYFLDKDYKIAVLVSEYMIHGDLKDYIEQKKPAWDARLQLIRDATDGLAYLHGQDPPILHGDLKAGNVLINAELRASLADFGLSKALQAGSTGLTTSDGLKGTLRYYSPELVSESDPDRCLPSDIWAWACLALEALTDKLPYATKNTESAIIVALMKSEIPIDIESLPIPVPDLKLLLAKCWAITPIERPSADYCLRILNLVSPSSHSSIHVGKITVQGSSKQPGFRPADSSVSPTNNGSGARPQNNADSGSRPNGEETEEEYEDAKPSGSNKDKFHCCDAERKASQAVKAWREDTSRAVGPSSNSVPSQLNTRIPQQRQARNQESKARPVVGSAPTQPRPREPPQTSSQSQPGPLAFYNHDADITCSLFGPPHTAVTLFPWHISPDPYLMWQYKLPGYSVQPGVVGPKTLFTTSFQVLETPSAISRRKKWAAATKLYKRKKGAFWTKPEAERWERERRERERRRGRRKALRQKRGLKKWNASVISTNGKMKKLDAQGHFNPRSCGLPSVSKRPTSGQWGPIAPPEDEDHIHAFIAGLQTPGPSTSAPGQPELSDGERAERLIRKLDAMDFPVRTYSFLPQVVNEESKKNIPMLDDQIIMKILEHVISHEELPARQRLQLKGVLPKHLPRLNSAGCASCRK